MTLKIVCLGQWGWKLHETLQIILYTPLFLQNVVQILVAEVVVVEETEEYTMVFWYTRKRSFHAMKQFTLIMHCRYIIADSSAWCGEPCVRAASPHSSRCPRCGAACVPGWGDKHQSSWCPRSCAAALSGYTCTGN